MEPALLVLAAGRGSRYGAPKQLEVVGPSDATLIDYAIFDARRAGFGRIVIAVRQDLLPQVRERIGARWAGRVPVEYVLQDAALAGLASSDRERHKPWGTAHAVLAAGSALDGPFAVVNGDDFYGAASFAELGTWLRGAGRGSDPAYALVTFALRDTLAHSGSVNRALVEMSDDGWVEDVREVSGLEREGRGGRYRDHGGGWMSLPGDAAVSMNLWGFTPAVFPQLTAAFQAFLEQSAGDPAAECLLPNVIGELIRRRAARVKALAGGSRWRGLTHRADLAAVRALIAELVAAGEYPEDLIDA